MKKRVGWDTSLLNKLFVAELEHQPMSSLPKLWFAKLEGVHCSGCNVCHSIWTGGGAGYGGDTGNRLFGGLGDQPASSTAQAVATGQHPTRKLGDTASLIQTKQDPTLFI